jgi:hypothetical protein
MRLERSPSTLLGSNYDESRAIDFFLRVAAPEISGFFHHRFWKETVFQASQQDPTIFKGMLAVSSMYEVMKVGTHSEYGLKCYNQAIQELVGHGTANPDSIRIPLVACLLFVCVDCLRGDTNSALMHINGGIKLLNTWIARLRSNGQIDFSKDPDSAFIRKVLLPMFSWLKLLSGLYGSTAFGTTIIGSEDTYASSFDTIEEAFMSYFVVLEKACRYVQQHSMTRHNGPAMETATLGKSLIAELEAWKHKVDQFALRDRHTWSLSTQRGHKVIHASHLVLTIWLESIMAPPQETEWDKHHKKYQEIIQLLDSVIERSYDTSSALSKKFAFECGTLAMLQFVAWRCRWPGIRRKALSLLKTAHRREVFFDSAAIYTLYEQVMKLEEVVSIFGAAGIQNLVQLPPEDARIHYIEIPPLPTTVDGRTINFLSKSPTHKSWHVRSEYLKISDDRALNWSDIQNYKEKNNSLTSASDGLLPVMTAGGSAISSPS